MSVCGFSPEGKWTHFWWWNHASFIAEIFDRGEQQTGNNGFWRERETGKEKISFFFFFFFLSWGPPTKFKGRVTDGILFIKLPKIEFSYRLPQQWKSFFFFLQHEIGGCFVVVGERRVAENCHIFVTKCWLFLREGGLLLFCTFSNPFISWTFFIFGT